MTTAAEARTTDMPDDGTPTRQRRLWPVLARLVLSAASGIVLYLSFAPRPLWWLAPLAFAVLGLALHGRRFWGAVGYGLVFGLAFNLLHVLWIEEFLGADFGSAPWLGVGTALALYVALVCGLMTFVMRLPAAPVWMALVFLSQELALEHWPFNGFPWDRVAFSQPEGAYLSLASIGGAPLVSFAVVVTGFGLAQLLLRIRERPRRGWVAPALAVVLPLLAGLAVWPTIGTGAQTGTRSVAIVQGNAPNIGLGLLDARGVVRANHVAETERLIERIRRGEVPRPDLVVWPETATEVEGGDDPQIDALADELGVPMLVGGLYHRPDGKAENSVITWRPGEGAGQRYVKQELVPYAEYVPWRTIAAWFTPFVDRTRDMSWGQHSTPLHVAGTTVGPVICYEVAYDYVSRELTNAGARLLVAPTNNAWYGDGEMTHQQLAMARLRAVEHSRAVVVASTSGISAIVAPDGTVQRQTGTYTATSLVAQVPLRTQTTLSDRLGAWTGYVLVGGGLAAVAAGLVLRRRDS